MPTAKQPNVQEIARKNTKTRRPLYTKEKTASEPASTTNPPRLIQR